MFCLKQLLRREEKYRKKQENLKESWLHPCNSMFCQKEENKMKGKVAAPVIDYVLPHTAAEERTNQLAKHTK